jgi:hypothetical protein
VKNDADAELVGGAFAAEGDVGGFVFEGHCGREIEVEVDVKVEVDVEDGRMEGGGYRVVMVLILGI